VLIKLSRYGSADEEKEYSAEKTKQKKNKQIITNDTITRKVQNLNPM
jgi:hypothetical protein